MVDSRGTWKKARVSAIQGLYLYLTKFYSLIMARNFLTSTPNRQIALMNSQLCVASQRPVCGCGSMSSTLQQHVQYLKQRNPTSYLSTTRKPCGGSIATCSQGSSKKTGGLALQAPSDLSVVHQHQAIPQA